MRATAMLLGAVLTFGAASANARVTTQSLNRQLQSLSIRVKQDERTIRTLRSGLSSTQGQLRTAQGQIQTLQNAPAPPEPVFTVRLGTNFGGVLGSDGGQALCQPGESIVGGGGGWGATGSELPGDHLMYSNPITNPPGWIAGGVHENDEFVPFEVFAICAH